MGVGVGTSWADDADDNAYGFFTAETAYAASEKIDLYGEIAYGFTPEQEIDGTDYDSNGEFEQLSEFALVLRINRINCLQWGALFCGRNTHYGKLAPPVETTTLVL